MVVPVYRFRVPLLRDAGFSAVEVTVMIVILLVVGALMTPWFLNHAHEVHEGEVFSDVAGAASLVKEARSHGEDALITGGTVSYGGKSRSAVSGVFELFELRDEQFCLQVVNDEGVTAHYAEKSGLGLGVCMPYHGPMAQKTVEAFKDEKP
jgi:hypothetical protein